MKTYWTWRRNEANDGGRTGLPWEGREKREGEKSDLEKKKVSGRCREAIDRQKLIFWEYTNLPQPETTSAAAKESNWKDLDTSRRKLRPREAQQRVNYDGSCSGRPGRNALGSAGGYVCAPGSNLLPQAGVPDSHRTRQASKPALVHSHRQTIIFPRPPFGVSPGVYFLETIPPSCFMSIFGIIGLFNVRTVAPSVQLPPGAPKEKRGVGRLRGSRFR